MAMHYDQFQRIRCITVLCLSPQKDGMHNDNSLECFSFYHAAYRVEIACQSKSLKVESRKSFYYILVVSNNKSIGVACMHDDW